MGGGLMQLVAYGAQDIYLTGNPQITFFKVVYRRHTNFSMESIQQTIDGSIAKNSSVSSTISRNGDLVYKMYLEFNPIEMFDHTGSHSYAANIGHTLLDTIDVEIGGQLIDRHYSHWLTTYTDLTEPNPAGLKAKQSQAEDNGAPTTLYHKMSFNYYGNEDGNNKITKPVRAYVPFQFWFNRNPGLALPLIALQYHEVKIKIKFPDELQFGPAAVESTGDSIQNGNIKLWADYIYLDTDERRRFAQVSHEYLIEQLQYESKSASTRMDLDFNHPVKELIWIGTPKPYSGTGTATNFESVSTPESVSGNFKLVLNGHDRLEERDFKYFTRTQVHQHHTGFGGIDNADSIAVYSFALKPEEHQPSGTCNFSRIDSAHLVGTVSQSLYVYAVNYNVLRIMSGMGGLAYSN